VANRLTDEDIARLDTTASWLVNKPDRVKLKDDDERRVGMRLSLALAELRERRAADMTDEQREALCICADIVRETLRQRTPWGNPSSYRQHDENNAHARVSRALAILDKLLGQVKP
jgi:hypothetical protein